MNETKRTASLLLIAVKDLGAVHYHSISQSILRNQMPLMYSIRIPKYFKCKM